MWDCFEICVFPAFLFLSFHSSVSHHQSSVTERERERESEREKEGEREREREREKEGEERERAAMCEK